MSKDLNVTSVDQIGLANRIQEFHDELQARITSLNGVVDRIQAGWQGAASQEYDRVQFNLNQRLKSMRLQLVKLEEIMRMSADGFTQQEEDRIAAFRKMDDTPSGQSAILGMA
ncbi:WXG100 family type VII secretion target [Streptomyces sp. NPDC059909]|uniref:WXG100 family type VII secretion target n=1 Tax=Streptomyces sp. NPDC059909 TaxID=3346998 RepID=UPI0036696BCE